MLPRVDILSQVGSLAASDPSPGSGSTSRDALALAVGLGVGLGVLAAAALIVVWLYQRRRRRQQQQQPQQQSVVKCEAAAISGDLDGGGGDGVKDKQGSVRGGAQAQAPWKAGLLALKGQGSSRSNDGTNGAGSPRSNFEQQQLQAQSG